MLIQYSSLSQAINTTTAVPLPVHVNDIKKCQKCNINKTNQNQCWGKLLLKVMHYNIALLPKKVTNYVTWLLFMESNVLCYFCVTFALLFKYEQGLIVFNTRSSNYSKCKSSFTPNSVMNKPQAERKVNSRLYSRTQEKKVQHSSAIKKQC